MIKISIVPEKGEKIYSLLVQKELSLRKKNKGTLHRTGPKKKNEDKWVHNTMPGWIKFQRCYGGMIVAIVQSKNRDQEWQLLSSFIGFLDRHFRDEINNINLNYVSSEK